MGGDASWIKSGSNISSVVSSAPASKPQPVEQPKPVAAASPFIKSSTGEIFSSKKPQEEVKASEPVANASPFITKSATGEIVSNRKNTEEAKAPVAAPTQPGVIQSTKKEEPVKEEKKVPLFNDAPKKLEVASVFLSKPKVAEFPIKKAAPADEVKKPNPWGAKEEPVPRNSVTQEPPKKLETPSVFNAAPKQEVKAPVKVPPKKLDNPFVKPAE
jgi:hypothetical protein